MRIIFFAFLLFFTLGIQVVPGQEKKPISHSDYSSWKTISGVEISPDGNWVIYQVYPQEGDGDLIIYNLENGSKHVIPRGYRASVSAGGEYVVCKIMPQLSVERQARKEGKKRSEMPADSLAIFVFDTQKLEKIAGLSSFRLPEEPSDWFVYNIDYSKVEDVEADDQQALSDSEPEDQQQEEQNSPDNKWLYVYNPVTGERFHMEDIVEYIISPFGTLVAGIAETKDEEKNYIQEIHTFDTRTKAHKLIETRKGMIRQIITDRHAGQMAWLHSFDKGRDKVYDLFHYNLDGGNIEKVVEKDSEGLPPGYILSGGFTPYFSEDGKRIFFGTYPQPIEEEEDTLLSYEKYSVDVWHYQDLMIQPQQKVMMERNDDHSFLAVYDIDNKVILQLGNEDFPNVSFDVENNSMKALSSSPRPYLLESSWAGGSIRDLYIEDIADGSRTLIKNRAESSVMLSPEGKFVLWYDPISLSWVSYDVYNKTTTDLTSRIPYPFYDEDNDVPGHAEPHGVAGWSKNDESVFIYDRHDIWKIDPSGKTAPENLTRGYARKNNLRFRFAGISSDESFIDLSQTLILEAFHYKNKRSGFFSLADADLEELIMDDADMFDPLLSANGKTMVWRRSTFEDYSDIWVGNKDFSQARKISDANPQQEDFLWGSVELVEWEDFEGNTLQGLLYLPEDLDPDKKYPTLVYFYERSSNSLHQHYIPSPSRSTINRPYSTSNGYVVFIPDITYKTGYPGQSAYNAIVSGTKAMIEKYPFIDSENIGLQGQSWGGYQVAYLVTRTNMFKAAMAGAPVSNMVSAYGGIRWGSGRSRQYQYENTQSRIGGTLWEKQSHYVENSPVFFADKVQTPLLIMHNDNDGAVPWYQGIEMFMALRRLSRPVWMLVYNDEAHNLSRWPNRMDLSIRMYQFFDYYLKDSPAPVWLLEGIPASQKGLVNGYDLIEN